MRIQDLYQLYLKYPYIQTDTRLLKPGDLFFALKGPSFNGNTFAKKAIDMGATAAIIDDISYTMLDKTILVDDVLQTLQQLAKYHREQFSIPFIAITGSNGKTTTKELIHAVLSTQYITYTTQGNLNNHIGIPLTILRIKKDAQLAVIEMGANHQKEIESYCIYTQPTHGIITNCGKAHLQGFGGEAGVRKGKGELYDYLRTKAGTIFVCNDYNYLLDMSKGIESVITYGSAQANIVGQVMQSKPFIHVAITSSGYPLTISQKKYTDSNLTTKFSVRTQLVGAYNLPNVLAAAAVGEYFKVPNKKIVHAIEAYKPSNSRSQWIERGTNKIILDAYNANPSSMQLAIENFSQLKATTKILLLGSMAELGSESIAEHQRIIQIIQAHSWQQVVLVGEDFKYTKHTYLLFDTAQQAAEWLAQQVFSNAYFLIKGSRSVHMEKLLDVIFT